MTASSRASPAAIAPARAIADDAAKIVSFLTMSGEPRPIFRFAPSPNGELHLGHALSAITCFRQAQAAGGRFLLRIEDIDITRSRAEYVQGIFDDLAWLGLSWEQPVALQSQRFDAYREAAGRLQAMGLLYPCFATRSEIEAAATAACDPDGASLYPGLWRGRPEAEVRRRQAEGTPHALRLDMAAAVRLAAPRLGGRLLTFREDGQEVEAAPERWGDAVIVRKDTPSSYHLAVVVDDAWQGVTHVTRGRDLLAATSLHRLLQVLLGLPEPAYRHHSLVMDEEGQKLSKSARHTSLRSLREQGMTREQVIARIGLAG
jgi:glutamyl-Q tRNA(Asp) synthetase